MNLADYYRTHGDSPHLLRLEDALTDKWQKRSQLVEASQLSRSYVEKATPILVQQGRAEKRRRHGANWYRLPQ
jgi:hypothetical protein